MFYDSNQVYNELLCKHCEGRLVEPKFIPCGDTICSFCEASMQINDGIFDCLVCKEKHEMPKNGLPICKPLLKLLSIMPTNVSRGESYDLLENLLNEMQKKTSFIRLGIENSSDFVKEHCMNLRSDVQLTAEESFHAINTEFLKEYKVDYKIIHKANEESRNLIKKAEEEIQNLKEIIFDGKIFKFDKNNEKINKSILGSTKIINNKMSSTILSGRNQVNQLMSLCKFPVDQKWNLIYRASQDGFEASQFHAKCDDKSNTLFIIKSTNGNVFGGYTEQTWNDISDLKADPYSYIFSLVNKFNKPIKLKCSTYDNSIYCHSCYGPTFGCKHDLHIADKSNTNTYSCSNLGESYAHPDYAYGSKEAKSFLAGSYNFQVLEIEVYTKQ
jgi:vacuolar-type H+-ATPase subunit H